MSTHAVTQTSQWDGTPVQVPDGSSSSGNANNTMGNATQVIEAMATKLGNNLLYLYNATAKLAAGNLFVGVQQIQGTGDTSAANIESVSGPHSQTSNTSNRWAVVWEGHTNRVNASQEAKVRLYVGDGHDEHAGMLALVANAHWDPSAGGQRWVHENSSLHASCVMLTCNNVSGGLFVGLTPVQASGTTWTAWPTGDAVGDTIIGNEIVFGSAVDRTVPIPIRTASGALVGPNSFQADGSFMHDATVIGVLGLPPDAVETLTARGVWWPIPIEDRDHEPLGEITVHYHSVYGGETFRICEWTNELTSSPSRVTRASVTTVAGDLSATLSYTANPGSPNSFYVFVTPPTTGDISTAVAGFKVFGISRSYSQTWLK